MDVGGKIECFNILMHNSTDVFIYQKKVLNQENIALTVCIAVG
jgi:hypothetical protein